MKNKNCPVCKSSKKRVYWAQRGYPLAKCLRCSMVWDYQFDQENESQYEKLYFRNENPKGGYANYFDGMAINKKTFAHRLNKIEKRLGKKGKLLDVGCALGDCLMVARDLGWEDIYGLELSKYASAFAKKRGLKVYQGTLFTKKFPSNHFDVVTMFDVIEHVDEPLSVLKEVKRILKKDGAIMLVTPDIGGYWSKVLGSNWYHYKPGEHLLYFSQNSISLALQDIGFKKVTSAKTFHIMSVEYIFNRLRFYSPSLFGLLLSAAKMTNFKNMPFRVYAGEIEAWGVKTK